MLPDDYLRKLKQDLAESDEAVAEIQLEPESEGLYEGITDSQ
jgi:hypothetical protein